MSKHSLHTLYQETHVGLIKGNFNIFFKKLGQEAHDPVCCDHGPLRMRCRRTFGSERIT